jgi:hypothetical protein
MSEMMNKHKNPLNLDRFEPPKRNTLCSLFDALHEFTKCWL